MRHGFITVHDLAVARGAKPDEDGGFSGSEYMKAGVSIVGGCACCEACVATYNAHPSRTGYWIGSCCVDGNEKQLFRTIREYVVWDLSQAAEDPDVDLDDLRIILGEYKTLDVEPEPEEAA